MYLRCLTFECPAKWSAALSCAEYWYNTSYHNSAAMTPFKALYGRDPPQLIRTRGSTQDPPDVQAHLSYREDLLQQLHANLHRAQQSMKSNADKNRRFLEFQVGGLVLVKLQPYRQTVAVIFGDQKLL
ncbi:transposon Tf2-1 polyprotein, partial [Trifolium medium]|nr:transposon Tf2-1 polyprotein [Trifolium medium]